MAYHNKKFRLFVARTWAVAALILANVVIYVASARGAEGFIPNTSTLLRFGAVTASAVTDHQYWRLLAAGFLHFNPVHLVSNMLCLAVWGGALEKRIGTLYFILIYFCSLLAGSLVTVLTHHTPFIGAGASGAVSGVLGALLGHTICCYAGHRLARAFRRILRWPRQLRRSRLVAVRQPPAILVQNFGIH